MTNHSFLIALMLGSLAPPLACSGKSSTTPQDDAGGTAGKAGTSGQGGGSGKGGANGSGGVGVSAGGSAGFGVGGRGQGGVPSFGSGTIAGMGGSRTTAGSSGTAGDRTSNGGEAEDVPDMGAAVRAPLCKAVCAYGPSASARVVRADTGAAGTLGDAGGAPGAAGTTSSGAAAQGGLTGTGGNETAGEGGAPASTPCGHEDACVAALCPQQDSQSCGDELTAFVACMADADADLVASLVTSCTEAQGPSLDTLIYQACYGEYADWTRSCL